jgi:hypothetical protein
MKPIINATISSYCDRAAIFVGTFQPRSPQMGGNHAPEEIPTGQAISATR